MPYNPLIPQANDKLRNSQGDLLDNFGSLNDAWLLNHVNFNAADAGKHKWLTMPQQVPGNVTNPTATDVTVYSALDAVDTNLIQLYLRRNSTPALPNIPINNIPMTQAFSNVNGFYSYLPSGILIQWGTKNVATIDVGYPNAVITLPKAFSTANNYTVNWTAYMGISQASVFYFAGASTTTTYSLTYTARLPNTALDNTISIKWMAIGY